MNVLFSFILNVNVHVAVHTMQGHTLERCNPGSCASVSSLQATALATSVPQRNIIHRFYASLGPLCVLHLVHAPAQFSRLRKRTE
jgi:hypothetical protein